MTNLKAFRFKRTILCLSHNFTLSIELRFNSFSFFGGNDTLSPHAKRIISVDLRLHVVIELSESMVAIKDENFKV